jgi:hypothetical protein
MKERFITVEIIFFIFRHLRFFLINLISELKDQIEVERIKDIKKEEFKRQVILILILIDYY